jgi:hypothetical protein
VRRRLPQGSPRIIGAHRPGAMTARTDFEDQSEEGSCSRILTYSASAKPTSGHSLQANLIAAHSGIVIYMNSILPCSSTYTAHYLHSHLLYLHGSQPLAVVSSLRVLIYKELRVLSFTKESSLIRGSR